MPSRFESKEKLKCKCNKSFVSQARLEIHEKKYHGGLGQQCKDCKKTFDSKKVLLDHRNGCQMTKAIFLDLMCLALRASGLWLP